MRVAITPDIMHIARVSIRTSMTRDRVIKIGREVALDANWYRTKGNPAPGIKPRTARITASSNTILSKYPLF